MFSKTFTIILYILSLFSNLKEIKTLVKLSSRIPPSQAISRDAIYKLFSYLKLTENNKIVSFSTVNNFLRSVTVDNHNILKEVNKLIRVNRNNKTDFIDIINEILDGDEQENNKIISNDEKVVEYIQSFINDLENWKGSLNLNDISFDINKKLLKSLKYDMIVANNTIDNWKYNESDIASDGEFWQSSGRRIFRGDRTKIKYFPFMASIQIFKSFQCGGSIIKSDLIITAASCLQLAWNNRFFRENPAFLSVRVGSTFYHSGGESIPVTEVYFHPDYNPRNLFNNICLLRLRRRLRFSKSKRKVKKIDIDRNSMKLPETTDGITIVGWGAMRPSNILEDPWKNRLSFAVLDFYPLRECRDVYSREYITNKHFCAGFFSKGGGACNRDVGGPGIVNGILTGVVSFGSPVCGTIDAPTVFTKIGHYSDWIDEIMEQDVPYAYKRTTLKPPRIIPYLATSTPQPKTTFVMPPISKRMKQIPLDEIDTLRILKDKKLFNEFLTTLFDKKKNTDKNIRNNEKNMKETSITESNEEKSNKIDIESTEMVTDSGKFTIINENANSNVEKDLEQDIVELMKNIDLIEDDGSSESAELDLANNKVKEGTKTMNHNLKYIETKNKINVLKDNLDQSVKDYTNNDSILTLLYLSDSEKKINTQDDAEVDGLTIPEKSFNDMTFRNNKTDILDFMSKNELYDLLAEATTN